MICNAYLMIRDQTYTCSRRQGHGGFHEYNGLATCEEMPPDGGPHTYHESRVGIFWSSKAQEGTRVNDPATGESLRGEPR